MTPTDVIDTFTHPSWGTFAGEILVLLGVIAFGVKKLTTSWKRESVDQSKATAEKSLVDLLHDELSRMAAQSISMSGEMLKLQSHILELTRQSGLLTSQVSALAAENNALRTEISHLRIEVARLQRLPIGGDDPCAI